MVPVRSSMLLIRFVSIMGAWMSDDDDGGGATVLALQAVHRYLLTVRKRVQASEGNRTPVQGSTIPYTNHCTTKATVKTTCHPVIIFEFDVSSSISPP